jgi:hypothetical protein
MKKTVAEERFQAAKEAMLTARRMAWENDVKLWEMLAECEDTRLSSEAKAKLLIKDDILAQWMAEGEAYWNLLAARDVLASEVGTHLANFSEGLKRAVSTMSTELDRAIRSNMDFDYANRRLAMEQEK